jgi:hypothetical protein
MPGIVAFPAAGPHVQGANRFKGRSSRPTIPAVTLDRRHTESGVPAAGSPTGTPVPVRVPVDRVIRVMWWLIAGLIAATFAAQVWHKLAAEENTVINLFDSDQKLNFPTSMKLALMLGATLLFLLVGLGAAVRHDRVRWMGIGALFALVTLDELTYMHQRISDAFHTWFGASGALRFAWIVIYVPALAVIAFVYFPWWRALPRHLRNGLLWAALLFAGGSAGMELAKGVLYDEHDWGLKFGLVAALSDSLELLGLGILVAMLLREVATSPRAVTIGFDRD